MTSKLALVARDEDSRYADDPVTGAWKVNGLDLHRHCDPVDGNMVWDPVRSLWNGGMLAVSVFIAPWFLSWDAVLICAALLFLTMCVGHSVGFHRLLIHRSFSCHRATRWLLAWAGTVFGMGGPFWVMRAHDLRDWGQRNVDCHPALRHGCSTARDFWWSLHCRLELRSPPGFSPGSDLDSDPVLHWLERTWMLQQLPLAMLLYLGGGLGWVVWGICVRVALGVHAHWYVGRLCHTQGPQSWHVEQGAVQAHNVAWAAIPSFGESWHNNHHAFPSSARHGLYPDEIDIGFSVIQAMERCGLAWDIKTPENLPERPRVRNVRAASVLGVQP